MANSKWCLIARNMDTNASSIVESGSKKKMEIALLQYYEVCRADAENRTEVFLMQESHPEICIFPVDVLEGHSTPKEKWLILKSHGKWSAPAVHTAEGTLTMIRQMLLDMIKSEQIRWADIFEDGPQKPDDISYTSGSLHAVNTYTCHRFTTFSAVPMNAVSDISKTDTIARKEEAINI